MDSDSLLFNSLDQRRKLTQAGAEYWMARDIQVLLGYSLWQNFQQVIQRARLACESAGGTPDYHFIETNKLMSVGKGAQIEGVDWFLSRYACYLVAMNGDPSKPEIGLAQTYFAVQARRQEVQDQLTDARKRILLRTRVKDANKNLNKVAKDAGVSNYAFFHDEGYLGLYDLRQAEIKRKKQIPDNESLLDRAGRAELAANEFRITQTEAKIKNEAIQGQLSCQQTHRQIGKKVRKTIREIGGTMPENLPPETHIKKLESPIKRLSGKQPKALPKPDDQD